MNRTEIDISWLSRYPGRLLAAVIEISEDLRLPVYIVGGAVRDGLLYGRNNRDLDLAVAGQGIDFARKLASILEGTFVLLDEREGVGRVVWQGYDVDLADFKDGSQSIEEDLVKRDFTINAMALAFPDHPFSAKTALLLDPVGGGSDLEKGMVRAVSERTFSEDPLRLLRAYRFQATLGFSLAAGTEEEVRRSVHLITGVARERVSYELDLIMASGRSCLVMNGIRDAGFFRYILPEMERGAGIEQPAGHHLDVVEHNLAALCAMEDILREPGKYFRERKVMLHFLEGREICTRLKWAAFFHDLGKPEVRKIRNERITFYSHDRAGAEQVRIIGIRLRWSREKTEQVSRLVANHMWPFHLCNVRRKEGVSARACLRLIRKTGEDLPGLFLLAMADSLASQGPGRPVNMEKELAELFSEVYDIVNKEVSPVLAGPPLLTGHDLIDLGLTPGPVFREILQEAEEARVSGEIRSREAAIDWLKNCVERKYSGEIKRNSKQR